MSICASASASRRQLGQRPHVNFRDVRCTSPQLASTVAFLDQEVPLDDNGQTPRTVQAFAANGGEVYAPPTLPARGHSCCRIEGDSSQAQGDGDAISSAA